MAGTGIMTGICTSPYPSPYPTEKVGDSPYPYPYPVNAGIPRQNGTGSGNTHGDGFICHLYRHPPTVYANYLFILFFLSIADC